MINKIVLQLFTVIFLTIGSSCTYLFPGHLFQSQARVVKVHPGKGGVIAISKGLDGESQARFEAEKLMAENCEGKYKILEEGEVVIGQTSQYRNDRNRGLNSTEVTREIREWHITYECRLTY